MAKLLNVGLYCKNGWLETSNDVDQRLADLSAAIDTAFDTLAPTVLKPAGAPPLPLNIFVAPEYLFKKNDHDCKTHNRVSAFTEREKDRILEGLLALSASRPNFLLLGGSVFWFEQVDKKHFWNSKPRNIVRNTVHVCHDGKLLLEYHKMNDCGELSPEIPVETAKHVFSRGLQPGLFDCDGLSCGVETCLDQDRGELRKVSTTLDLHFVASNTVTVTADKVACADDKLVIQANACPPKQPFGNIVMHRPWAWDSKYKLASEGQVSFGRFVLP